MRRHVRILDGMDDDGRELGAFLRSRRARVAPGSVGVVTGTHRRVPGLRREELAQLAGISVDYYVRLEQGRSTRPSAEILDALARVLALDATEREHLRALTEGRRSSRSSSRPRPERVRPELARLLGEMAGLPAIVTGRRQDVLAWNRLGSELFGGLDEGRRDATTRATSSSTHGRGRRSRTGTSVRGRRWRSCGWRRAGTPMTSG